MSFAPCLSCKLPSKQTARPLTGSTGSCGNGKDKNCGLSQCAFKAAPVKYKLNERNYYSEMHGRWRYHCRNKLFVHKFPFCKTNYLRVGPNEELIWNRNTWDKVKYSKRCPRNTQCCPWELRGYTAWVKREIPQEDPFFTGGPKGDNVVPIKPAKELTSCCGGVPAPPPEVIDTRQKITSTVFPPHKRFRFLDCGPLKPGWGCSGQLSCHLDDGFCPIKTSDCECRGEFKGAVGCGECCGKTGKPSLCREYCGWDKFRMSIGARPAPCCMCVEEEEPKERTRFGRVTMFKPLEKVPPMDLDDPMLERFKQILEEKKRQRELELEEEEEENEAEELEGEERGYPVKRTASSKPKPKKHAKKNAKSKRNEAQPNSASRKETQSNLASTQSSQQNVSAK